MIGLSPSSAGTVEDLIHLFFHSIQDMVVQEVIPVVNVEGQVHFSGGECPIKEDFRLSQVYEE